MRKLALITLLFAASCSDDETSLVSMAQDHTQHGRGMHSAIPILHVANLKASQNHFRDVLGFKVEWEYGEPPDFGAVRRDDAIFFLCEQCQGTPGAWSFIFAKDVDALHDELRNKNARIVMPPTNMPWELREMQVADLDGNMFRFACPIRR
jgi:hypothetical protein